jgi:hypothetical protein
VAAWMKEVEDNMARKTAAQQEANEDAAAPVQ